MVLTTGDGWVRLEPEAAEAGIGSGEQARCEAATRGAKTAVARGGEVGGGIDVDGAVGGAPVGSGSGGCGEA